MSVREELEKLGRLQELDLKIDRARKLVSGAPAAYKEIENQIATETANLNSSINLKAELEKQKRSLETEITMDQDRIRNIDGRIGSVTNNKEYHAISKEADKAKKMISDRQKMIEDITAKVTAQEVAAEDIQKKLHELNAELEKRKSEVGTQVGEADKEIQSYAGDRNSIVAEINPPLMSRYNRIRARYPNALAPVRSGHCTSCNVALPPQMYIIVQKGLELVTCPNCQRLLYYTN
jgi:uncharacterized protein